MARGENVGDFIRFLVERKYSLFEKIMFTIVGIFGAFLVFVMALAYAVYVPDL